VPVRRPRTTPVDRSNEAIVVSDRRQVSGASGTGVPSSAIACARNVSTPPMATVRNESVGVSVREDTGRCTLTVITSSG